MVANKTGAILVLLAAVLAVSITGVAISGEGPGGGPIVLSGAIDLGGPGDVVRESREPVSGEVNQRTLFRRIELPAQNAKSPAVIQVYAVPMEAEMSMYAGIYPGETPMRRFESFVFEGWYTVPGVGQFQAFDTVLYTRDSVLIPFAKEWIDIETGDVQRWPLIGGDGQYQIVFARR